VRVDTELKWAKTAGALTYNVLARRTNETEWRSLAGRMGNSRLVDVIEGGHERGDYLALVDLRGDDWLFGVAACVDEYCSPVASAVPGGAFEPVGKE